MHRNFQRVEQYNMFSLLLLTPKYRPLCLYTLHLAYLCLDRHNVLPQREEAEIRTEQSGLPLDLGDHIPSWRKEQRAQLTPERMALQGKVGQDIQRLWAFQHFILLPSSAQFLSQSNEMISDKIILKTIWILSLFCVFLTDENQNISLDFHYSGSSSFKMYTSRG